MPTPERIKLASLAKRKRICTVCGAHFIVAKADRKGAACGPVCLSEVQRRNRLGKKATVETKAKMSASQKAFMAANPAIAKRRVDIGRAALKHLWAEDAEALARASSERMKARHKDPDFQQRRDERSSRVMKDNWKKHRELFVQQSKDRYKSGITGLNEGEAADKRDAASKWIMKKAQEALHTETDFDDVFTAEHNRLRREMPYDGPKEGSDYMEYLGKLARAVNASPKVRAIADTFMREAIPRFAEEWQAQKLEQEPE